MGEHGAPVRLRGVAAIGLLAAELGLAVLLLPPAAARGAGWGIAALEREGLPVHAVNEDADAAVFADFGVPGTPFVVYVADGLVAAKGLVNTLEQIEELIAMGEGRMRAAA